MHTIPIELFGREIRIPELKNKHHLNIVKLCNSEDLHGLNEYFEEHIFANCSIKKLNILEKFGIMLATKILCVDRILRFKDKHNTILEYDLMSVLDRVESVEPPSNKTIKFSGVQIDVGLPNTLYFHDNNDIFAEVLQGIDGVHLDNLKQREEVLQRLPQEAFKQLQEYISDISQRLYSTQLIDENEHFGISAINLNIVGNTLLHILKMLFQQNMKNYWENMYHFLNKICQDVNFYNELTPIESAMFINFYATELKKQQENRDKSNKS